MKNVLVICAHADDECLGVGGTMAKYADNGDKVHTFVLCPDRIEQSEKALNILCGDPFGFNCHRAMMKDQRFDDKNLLDIIQGIEQIIFMIKPQIVYTHFIGDLNLDHSITARATLTACRPLPSSTVEAIYGFEIPSSTEWGTQPFHPTHYISLNDVHTKKKFDALQCYGTEIKDYPHARSKAAILSQLAKRGCEVGVNNAEAFHTYRTIS